MAPLGEKNADRVLVPWNNPSREKPETIITQIPLAGRPFLVEVEGARAGAIDQTVAAEAHEEVIVIAGKGHEEYQEIAGVKHAFLDQAHARAALEGCK